MQSHYTQTWIMRKKQMGIDNKNFLARIVVSALWSRGNQLNMKQLCNPVSTIIEMQFPIINNPKVVLMHRS